MTDFQREKFGQDVAYVVKNVPMLKAHVEARLAEMYNISSTNNHGQDRSKRPKLATNCNMFPGAIICSLLKSDVSSLVDEKNNYVALEKTDGVRYLLLLTTLNQIPYAILIDRKMEMRVVNLDFSIALYEQEALFDGELAQNIENGLFHFLIFDLIYTGVKLTSGEPLYRNAPYTLRMKQANNIVQTMWQKQIQTEADYSFSNTQVKNTFSIKVKRYISLCNFRETFRQTVEKNIWTHHGFRVDGFVFVRSRQRVEPFRNEEQFKFKPKHLHTIDVQLYRISSGSFDLLIKNSRNSPQFYAKLVLCAENLDFLSQNAPKIDEFEKTKQNFIVECEWNDKEQTWILKNHRVDKQTPNALNTIEQTKKNIEEDIKLEELVQKFDCLTFSGPNQIHRTMAHQLLESMDGENLAIKNDTHQKMITNQNSMAYVAPVAPNEPKKGCFVHPSRVANIVACDNHFTTKVESEKKPISQHKLSPIYDSDVINDCDSSCCDKKKPVLPQFSLEDLEKLLAQTSNVNLSLFTKQLAST